MPRNKDAKVIGRCECPACGGGMAVLQNKRDYLYSNCDNCGCDQRNGKKVQEYLWHNTRWIDGVPDRKPRNVSEEKPVDKKVPVNEPEHEPSEPEKDIEKQKVSKKPSVGWFLVPVAVLAAIGLKM